ncbi:hypothetical protein BT96DRAFT_832182, partial [Gymnopus androsaceus JB14]
FRYQAPIETEAAVKRVVQVGLLSLVSIQQEDLLAIVPDYMKKVKEGVTSCRIGIDGNLLDIEEPTYLLNWQSSSPATVDLTEEDKIYVGKELMSIRGIMAVVGECPIHCITDWGCSIIAMLVAMCNVLGVMFDPTCCIPLQSANGKMDCTLGIARDISFCFGRVTAILQVHIVNSPTYNVLLGRPFEMLTQAQTQSFLSGNQHITLTNPNTKRIITISTIP